MLEPTIYYTQSKHTYYYTIDARTLDRSTTLKVSTLTITPSMLEPTIYYTQSQHSYYYTTDARTHDLLHSKSARLLLHHRCSNPLSTTLKVSTVTITPPMLEPTIYYTQSQHAYYYTIDARTHDLLHSKSARLLLHHRCSNPRSTLKVSTLTITPSMLEPRHDLLHSKSARLLLHHRCSNPRSTTLKVSTLTITPPMLEPTIYYTQSQHGYYYTTDAVFNNVH